MAEIPAPLERVDRRFLRFTRENGSLILRGSLGFVFVWFGALKLSGDSPVAAFVASTTPWVNSEVIVPALGLYEVIVGVGLWVGRFPRVVLGLFLAQMAATFLAFLVQPGLMFVQGNPLLLTMEGEFVMKNIVLMAAGLALAGTIRTRRATGGARLGRRGATA